MPNNNGYITIKYILKPFIFIELDTKIIKLNMIYMNIYVNNKINTKMAIFFFYKKIIHVP